jgi:hypothetical protein
VERVRNEEEREVTIWKQGNYYLAASTANSDRNKEQVNGKEN